MDKETVDQLYGLYEFEKNHEDDFCTVYTYEQGYFNNAEIILFKEDNRLNDIKNDYLQLGYSVSVKKSTDYDRLRRELFNGFFKIEASKRNILHEYEEYSRIQSKRLGEGNSYSYINSKYMMNGSVQSQNILKVIYDKLLSVGAQLVILEAPAGFGKTCTSYEIVKMIASNNQDNIPILAELSKNRGARIFRYVLLTEIDRKFSKLSSNLVMEQIKLGNIPLIIDGFDELLSRKASEDDESVEEATTMLDTIAELFEEGGNAKILLTSRKSSIFTGDVYEHWITSKLTDCEITRIQILNPTVIDWIGYEKKSFLEKRGIILDHIANPVLFSMLRNLPVEEFESRFKCASDVLEHYFSIMLEREKERQQLLITVEEQRMIIRKLAANMVILDISADEPEGMKALIEVIVNPKMVDYLALYSNSNRYNDMIIPTEDELISKLVHSALLDRVNINSNKIGFINEFIFGILIGDAILEKDLDIKDVSEKYLNFAISSYAAESADKRTRLCEIICDYKKDISTEQKLSLDINLSGSLQHDYVDEYISNTVFESVFDMQTEHYFYNCVFEACVFDKNEIENILFEGCHFINCVFYEMKINRKGILEEKSIFISCSGYESLQQAQDMSIKRTKVIEEKDEMYYERIVLEQFWMKGSTLAPRRTHRTLLKGVKQQDKAHMLVAIQNLLKMDLLRELMYCLEINYAKLADIKRILGR